MKKLYELQYDYINASMSAYNRVVDKEITLKELVEIGYNMILLVDEDKTYSLGYEEDDFDKCDLCMEVKGLYTDFDNDGYEVVYVELVNKKNIKRIKLDKYSTF